MLYSRPCKKRSGHHIDCDKTPTLGNGTKDVWNDTICETPPQNMATIVTVYYNMRSKQPTHEYKRWMPNMLQAMDPVIICDPTSAIDNTLPLYWWYSPFRGWMCTKFGTRRLY